MQNIVRQIVQRMSLRTPQQEALSALVKAVNLFSMEKREDRLVILDKIKSTFPSLSDFERDFPNLSFALATGVGKTRLIAAMMVYLCVEKKMKDFVLFAPGTTILEKLEREFSDPNDPKYVFKGLGNFLPSIKVVTSENFEEGYGVRRQYASQKDLFEDDDIHIYIFNIAKMNSDGRKMKRGRETIVGGMSYFDYLAQIENLVVFMDEAHRYRAPSSSKAIEDLKPILGIEMTATPQVESSGRSISFKNIIYQYPLSQALQDGYVKEPWVAGRKNFVCTHLSESDLERIKLEDGIRIHENTKVHLQSYAYKLGTSVIKPFVLVIASSLAHANELEKMITGDDFFGGQYKHKVRVVHSGVDADKEERMVRDLLEIESYTNPIEIVIHVNMLKEGWDVVNLYTIIPLRAANSKTLIEQSLGRGLRLPFGKRTNYSEVDRLTIVSHDRFDEIIEECNRAGSLIRKGIDIDALPLQGSENIQVEPLINTKINEFAENEKGIASSALQEIAKGNVDEKLIIEYIASTHPNSSVEAVSKIVRDTIRLHDALSIRVPRIQIHPEIVKPGKYHPIVLDLQYINFKPDREGIILINLCDRNKEESVDARKVSMISESPQCHLAKLLIDIDSISENEEHTDLVLDLAEQMIAHLKKALDENEVALVIEQKGPVLAELIYAQMQSHYEPPEIKFTSIIGRDFTFLKNIHYTKLRNDPIIHYHTSLEKNSDVTRYLFNGFNKSIYSTVRFDSNSERLFACLIERDEKVIKWLKPPKKSLYLEYESNVSYEPDFIIETSDRMFMCEIKSSAEIKDPIVLRKKDAALAWCETATKHALQYEGKPWFYLLIPHDTVKQSYEFSFYVSQYRM